MSFRARGVFRYSEFSGRRAFQGCKLPKADREPACGASWAHDGYLAANCRGYEAGKGSGFCLCYCNPLNVKLT